MRTDEGLAKQFCEELFVSLRETLSDVEFVRARVAALEAHAPAFPESRFCKGCVLPVVDNVATQFLGRQFGADHSTIRNALRCEGYTTLAEIYAPGPLQVGFGGYTWGKNFQRVSKSGKEYTSNHRGYQPCPDFGVVLSGEFKFAILGEVKYSSKHVAASAVSNSVINDLNYYLSLPYEPENDWEYDFGLGIAYASGGMRIRRASLITEHWKDKRYVVACFSE